MLSRGYFPSERTAPLHVLEGCRLVDPAAELLYAGDGTWILGVMRFSWPAYQQAWQTMAKLDRTITRLPYQGGTADENNPELVRRARSNAKKRAYHRLALHGWRQIAVYRVQGPPTSAITIDFQYRDFEWRIFQDFGLDLVLEEAIATEDHGKLARINKLRDALRTHGTASYRYLGGQRHIQTIGSKGAACPA